MIALFQIEVVSNGIPGSTSVEFIYVYELEKRSLFLPDDLDFLQIVGICV